MAVLRNGMKVAAIDIGSNSIHMVIVEVNGSGSFEVRDREKRMVRLGSGTLSGDLPAEAMARGLSAMREFKTLADRHGVEKIIAVATSAVREAKNGEDFVEQVGREIGVWPLAVSGDQEARLIYLAVLHSVHLLGKRTAVIDIGGGSVEVAIGKGRALQWAASEKLGVLRMTDGFVHSDPLSSKDEDRLVRHVRKTIAPHAARAREVGFDCAVGTSGTILAIGALAYEFETGTRPHALHHVTVSAAAVHAVRKRITALDLRARLKLPGLDARRADIIVAGSVVLDTLLQSLRVPQLVLCEWALREGILLDYIHGHRRSLARAKAYPDVRRRSIMHLAERCQFDSAHGRHVAMLAVSLFDATRARHGLDDSDRALLEYAALLHDIGHHISHPGHHKHTYYLIKNGDLRGFGPEEIDVLANVARYHRRGFPSKKDMTLAPIGRIARHRVRVLAGLLRLADAFDRSHRQVVRSLEVTDRHDSLRIRCQPRGDCGLELWGAQGRKDLLERMLGLEIRVEQRKARRAESAPRLRSGSG
jgi:exopolyphosphatase/guanosine-5'-triphosphate,3'-diphosphate pyrophosphatase